MTNTSKNLLDNLTTEASWSTIMVDMEQSSALNVTLSPPSEGPVHVPQYLLTIMNGISLIAIGINLIHIVFMTAMTPGRSVGALNFKHYILVLAYTDLFASIFRLGVDNKTVQQAMYDEHVLCVAGATFMHGLLVFETNSLALVSVERFLSVWWPQKYSTLFYTRHFLKIMICSLCCWWTIYIIFAGLYSDRGYSVKGSGSCRLGSPELPKLGYLSSLSAVVHIIIIILFYILFIVKVIKAMKIVKKVKPSEHKQLRQTAITVNVIVMCKLICWSPMMIAIILRGIGQFRTSVDYTARTFMMIYAILSPVLYSSTSQRYRRFVRRRLCRKSSRSTSNTNSSHASVQSTSFATSQLSNTYRVTSSCEVITK